MLLTLANTSHHKQLVRACKAVAAQSGIELSKEVF